jgi:predicted transcriptional regulator
MSEFEKQVRHALLDREMSLSDLAELLGISVSYIYEIIKGTRKAEDQKQRIITLLGLDYGKDDSETDC